MKGHLRLCKLKRVGTFKDPMLNQEEEDPGLGVEEGHGGREVVPKLGGQVFTMSRMACAVEVD